MTVSFLVTSIATRLMTLTDDVSKFLDQKGKAEVRLNAAKEKYEKELELCKSFIEAVSVINQDVITCVSCDEQQVAPEAWTKHGFKKAVEDGESFWLCDKCFEEKKAEDEDLANKKICEECGKEGILHKEGEHYFKIIHLFFQKKDLFLCFNCYNKFVIDNVGTPITIKNYFPASNSNHFYVHCGRCFDRTEDISIDKRSAGVEIFQELNFREFFRYSGSMNKDGSYNKDVWFCKECSDEWRHETEIEKIEDFIESYKKD